PMQRRALPPSLTRHSGSPREFKPGRSAVTPLGQIGCVLIQVDDRPAFDLIVPSTFARAAVDWLETAAAELVTAHAAILLAPPVIRQLRNADLANRIRHRQALAAQNFNLPKLRDDLIGLVSLC